MTSTDHPPLEIQYANRGGKSIGFTSLGSGLPVLWMAPLAIPLEVTRRIALAWDFISSLAETNRALLVDDPYVGHTRRPVPPSFLDDYVADLVAVLDHAEVSRCAVVANFLTAVPAVALAARHPERVSSLLLWNGLLDGREAFAERGARELFSLMQASSRTVAGQTYVGTFGVTGSADELRKQREFMAEALDRYPLHERLMFRGLIESDSTVDAEVVRCPTLVVAPSAAVVPPRSAVRRAAQRISSASLIELETAALAMELDSAVAMPVVASWLQRTEPEAERSTEKGQASLTPREVEVLSLVEQGLTNPEVAERLTITRHTVAKHLSNAMHKLDARNRTEASRVARERGLLHSLN